MRIVSKFLFATVGASWVLSMAPARADEASIYFSTGSSDVKPDAVKKIVKKAGEGAAFHVSGWTDPRGSEEINRRLRADRAESVKKALVAAGVAEEQIQLEDGAAGSSSDKKSEWKMRRAQVRYDGGHAAAVASKSKPVESNARPEETVKVEPPKKEPEQGTKVAMNTTHPSTGTNPPSAGTEPSAKKLEPIKLIYWRALNHALWIVAKDKGFFEEEGFDATLVETDEDARVINDKVNGRKVAGDAQTTNVLEKNKKYTAGAVCGFATHEAMAHGDPIVDIGSMIMLPETLLMKKATAEAIDKDLRAFKGLKIGDMSSGEGKHEFKYNNVLRVQLERAGLKDDQDFHIIEYKDSNKEFEALASGQLDVAKVFPPSDIAFTKSHPEYVRVPFAKFFPYLPCCRQVITRAQLKDNRGKYVRLLRASIRAHQFIVEHPKEAAQIIGAWLKIPAGDVRASIMSAYVTLTPDPMRKGVELYQRTNDKFTNTKTSTAEFIDTSLYRDALVSLSREADQSDDPRSKGYYSTMLARFRANN